MILLILSRCFCFSVNLIFLSGKRQQNNYLKRSLTYLLFFIISWLGLSSGLHSTAPSLNVSNFGLKEQAAFPKTVIQNDCLVSFNQLSLFSEDDDNEQEDDEDASGEPRKWYCNAGVYAASVFAAGHLLPGRRSSSVERYTLHCLVTNRQSYLCIFRI